MQILQQLHPCTNIGLVIISTEAHTHILVHLCNQTVSFTPPSFYNSQILVLFNPIYSKLLDKPWVGLTSKIPYIFHYFTSVQYWIVPVILKLKPWFFLHCHDPVNLVHMFLVPVFQLHLFAASMDLHSLWIFIVNNKYNI